MRIEYNFMRMKLWRYVLRIKDKKAGRKGKYDYVPEPYNLYFDPELKKKVISEAQEEDITPSNLVMDAIRYYLSSREKIKKEENEDEKIKLDDVLKELESYFNDAEQVKLSDYETSGKFRNSVHTLKMMRNPETFQIALKKLIDFLESQDKMLSKLKKYPSTLKKLKLWLD